MWCQAASVLLYSMIQLTRGDTIQSHFAQNMSAKKPETNDFYQHYSLDKPTFKNDNFLLSNEGKKETPRYG